LSSLLSRGCAGPRYNQLSPDVKKVAFSVEEDAMLIKVGDNPSGRWSAFVLKERKGACVP